MSFAGDLMCNPRQKHDYQGFIHRFEHRSPAEGHADHEVLQRCQQAASQLSPRPFIRS